jgi:hypothetical protein
MAVGPTYSAYTFRSRDSLLTEYVALKEVGIQPHVAVQHRPTTSLYYRDPDGITEMQIDNMAPDEATHYLRGSSISTPAASSRVSAPSIRCAHVDTSGIDEAIARLEQDPENPGSSGSVDNRAARAPPAWHSLGSCPGLCLPRIR